MKILGLVLCLLLSHSILATPKDLTRIEGMQRNPQGDYTVKCIDGTTEIRTAADLAANNVCFYKVAYLPKYLSECTQNSNSYNCQINIREQSTPQRSTLAKVIFIVDNSGSMGPHQERIASNIGPFIQTMGAQNQWQGILLSTDKNDDVYFEDQGQTLNRASKWKEKITSVGTNGDFTEQGLQSVIDNLANTNMGQSIKDNLHLIFISDEDDQTIGGAKNAYVEIVNKYRVDADKLFTYQILSSNQSSPRACSGSIDFKYEGSQFEQLAKMTSGKLYDLCSPKMSETMQEVARDILAREAPKSTLLELKIDTATNYKNIKVILDGKLIPEVHNKIRNWSVFNQRFIFTNEKLINLQNPGELKLEFIY